VLAIARDQAHPPTTDIDTVITRATSAGHRIVARRTVADLQGPIRDWLSRWIEDTAIDCIIVLGGDSTTISSALQPLVTRPVPGFSDLFRWLMFQEIGASAMLSTAEAAQCGGTFVFVVPGAVGAVMDKLILPQLDPRATPRSLVAPMPRLAGLIGETDFSRVAARLGERGVPQEARGRFKPWAALLVLLQAPCVQLQAC
jgi:molybdenum cofactor biosynthesis protein B